MSRDGSSPRLDADALARAFDEQFAVAPAEAATAAEVDLLVLRLGGAAHVIRLSEVAGLFAERPLAPLPGGDPAFRGIAAFRGVLRPVWDLGLLLGFAAEPLQRWLVLAQEADCLFSFAVFERHLRAPIAALSLAAEDGSPLAGLVKDGKWALPLISIPATIAAIRRRVATAGSGKEP